MSAARRALATGVLLAALGATVACGADDRALKPPSPDQTTTTRPPASLAQGAEAVVGQQFELTSTAFAQNGGIPDRYTCRGMGVAPPLTWRTTPPGTEELAVVMRARDASRTIHWVMSGIPPQSGELGEASLPQTAKPFPNQVNGQPGWAAPCPSAPGTYQYDFMLYAFEASPDIPPLSDGEHAAQIVEAAPRLGVATITGTVTVTG